jgi:hypothetical protein
LLEPAPELATHGVLDPFGIDPGVPCRLQAMLAEAQAQQEGPDLAQILEVAFVVVAVAESVEVQRFGEDVGDPVAGDV